MKKRKEYTLYKRDDILAVGTVEEIAEKLGVNKKTILFYLTPTYKKRVKKSKGGRRELIRS